MKKSILTTLGLSFILTSTVLAQETACFSTWVDRHGNPIYSGTGKVVYHNSPAEDCIQNNESIVVLNVYKIENMDSKSRSILESSISTVFFDFDKYTLRPEGELKLDEIASAMKESGSYDLVVRGHADKTGPSDYNQELSMNRAKAVQFYLISKGIDRDRVITQGFGETHPLSPWNDQLNRRVEFIAVTRDSGI